ncbi:hypothetical protein [Mycobacterium canetti]|nr:hypothetical protein [Mycobacterium canetti]
MTAIYLAYNASSPIDRRVADVMYLLLHEASGKPSSNHSPPIDQYVSER